MQKEVREALRIRFKWAVLEYAREIGRLHWNNVNHHGEVFVEERISNILCYGLNLIIRNEK